MLPMVSPSIILNPAPKPMVVAQDNVVEVDGQDPLYNAYPRLPVLPVVVWMPLLNRRITDAEFAVNEYQISSLLSMLVQEGFGDDCVAPVVFADTEAAQLVPNGCVVTGIAFAHSSFAGGAGTSCIQKSKLASFVRLAVQKRRK